jgi:hypothetical protein
LKPPEICLKGQQRFLGKGGVSARRFQPRYARKLIEKHLPRDRRDKATWRYVRNAWRRHDGCCRGVADREGENMAGYHPSRRMHRTSLSDNSVAKTP